MGRLHAGLYGGEVEWTPFYCEQVAREFLEETADRWAHVRSVATVAANLAMAQEDRSVVVSAAWLHDIGYSRALAKTGMHAIDGAVFLDTAGAPAEIVSLVAFHTGAVFEAEERGLMDKLVQFDMPREDHLDALILADLLCGPDGSRVSVASRLAEIQLRYEPQHPVYRAVARSRPYLEACAARAAERVGYPM